MSGVVASERMRKVG